LQTPDIKITVQDNPADKSIAKPVEGPVIILGEDDIPALSFHSCNSALLV
jgi:hypothetical protein